MSDAISSKEQVYRKALEQIAEGKNPSNHSPALSLHMSTDDMRMMARVALSAAARLPDETNGELQRLRAECAELQRTNMDLHGRIHALTVELESESTRDAELLQSFWLQILKAWGAQSIVSDRVGLDVSIGAPLIEAARRALKSSPAPQCPDCAPDTCLCKEVP